MTKVLEVEPVFFLFIIVWQGVFTTTIETTTFKGSNTTIDCPLSSTGLFPLWRGPPNFLIYNSGDEFSQALGEKKNRMFFAANRRSLFIINTTFSDSGSYKCTENINEGINVVTVKAKPGEPSITTSAVSDNYGVRASQGQPLTVTCTSFGGKPAPTVVWYRGDQMLNSTGMGNKAEDGTYNVTLKYTFEPTRQDDRQRFVCRSYWPAISNSQDTKENNVLLYLYLKPFRPTVKQSDNVVTGTNITVECVTSGSRPAANIFWKYMGNTYNPAVTVMNDTSTQTFTITSVLKRPVNATDNGKKIYCTVTHITGNLTEYRTLNVQFGPVNVTIHKPSNIIANGQQLMSISCSSGSSNPAAEITWNTGDIQHSKPSVNDTVGEYGGTVRTSTISFKPTREDDGKTVSCMAKNVNTGAKPVYTTVIDNIQYSPLIAYISNVSVVEGDRTILKCNASSKPPARFTWKKGQKAVFSENRDVAYNGLNFLISNTSRNDAGTYTCTADNQIPPPDTKQSKLTVLYPPDITVIAVNTTTNSSSTTVTCNASGVPDHYNYSGWKHTWDGQEVDRGQPLPSARVLNFTDLTYAQSGTYTCMAGNGIKSVSHGSGILLVKSFPIITGDVAKKMLINKSGQLMQPMAITLDYFSNAPEDVVKVYMTNGTEGEVGDVNLVNAIVQLPVFFSNITTPGKRALINITATDESQFGAYQIVVSNEIGSVNVSLIIQPFGPPESPLNVNIAKLDHQSVEVIWTSGFPNGLNQTFVVQLSTDKATWQNFTEEGGLSFQQTHRKDIHPLFSSTLYYMRMIAYNDKGMSKPTSVLNFTTKAQPDSLTEDSTVLIAGGAAGGAVAAVAVAAVIVFVWRRRGFSSPGNQKDKGTLVDKSNENLGFDDREEVVNRLYESTSRQQEETTLTASTSKPSPAPSVGVDIYSKVNKRPEDLYALPDKAKTKDGRKKKDKKDKARTATGDVYENAPKNINGNGSTAPSGDNVYEDTSMGSAEVPRKPTRSDGLVYADLEFKSPPKGKGQSKIIGIDERCEYTTIDLTKKAKPLPDTDN